MSQQYLSSEIISNLSSLSLKARLLVEGLIVGMHKSPYHGFSVEFSEHRLYNPGDEIRNIDWKIWGKTDKYFVKEYEEETNLLSHIILDQSASMSYSSSNISKLDYAKTLAASLAYLMLKQQDGVGLTLFDSKIRSSIPPKSKSNHINSLFKIMEDIIPGPDTNIGDILHISAESIKKRGLVIIISDFFDNLESIISGIKHYRYKGNEVILFHILDDQELKLDFNERTQFIDLETNETITTDPWHIRAAYQAGIQQFCNDLKINCRKNKVDYTLIDTSQPIEIALFDYLLKRKNIVN